MACGGGEVGFPSECHGFDDAACLAVDASVVVDLVQLVLEAFGLLEQGGLALSGMYGALAVGGVGGGADALMEEVFHVGFMFALCLFCWLEMLGAGKEGVARLQ